MRPLLLLALLAAPLTAQPERVGLYHWVGVAPEGETDQLTAARERTAELGLGVLRLYLGARYDYQRPYLSPERFAGEIDGARTPAAILQVPRYAAVLDDPRLSTVVLTVYESRDYGGGSDDINLLRPWSDTDARLVDEQISALCRLLYERWGGQAKTVILSNHEADEKIMEILQHSGGDIELVRRNLAAWMQARQAAVERVRAENPQAQLQLYNAFEISVVNLRIAKTAGRYQKTNIAAGVTALEEVVPLIRTDLISYSSYESINSPYETRQPDAPEQIAGRIERDLQAIYRAAVSSISPVGRARFGDKFIMLGELGFPREKFEPLPSGGVLARLETALKAAFEWGAPYVVLWQAFDAPRLGAEGWGYGVWDSQGRPPKLKPSEIGCATIAGCLPVWLAR